MGISNLFDEYELKARLRPALIVIFPAVFACFLWFPELRNLGTAIVTLFATLGILTLIAKISRNVGKSKEKMLYKKWGGMPTTYLLRYNNKEIDSNTKKRYHLFLQNSISDLNLPVEEEERKDVDSSDKAYESAVRWLREKTRDKKQYPMIFRDNVSYGFSRNLWSMKPMGIVLSIAVFLVNLIITYNKVGTNISNISFEKWIIDTVSLLLLFIWIFLINTKWVHNEAEAYARSLLAICEQINSTKVT